MRVPGLALLALATSIVPLHGQGIQVTLVEERSRLAVPGLVSVLSLDGDIVARALTNPSGYVMIPVPAGRYVVEGARIGFFGARSDTLTVVDGGTVILRLGMPMDQVVLPEVVIEARRSECSARDRSPDLQTVWEEARKVLATVVLTREQLHPMLEVVRFERSRGPLGALVSDREVARRRGPGNPYHTLTPSELLDEGFSRTTGGQVMFYAPDADLLLSDDFLATHCFGLTADPVHDRIGLTFTPMPSRTQTGIAGTLWMNRAERELEEVEFEYVKAPYPYNRARATGVVRFARMPRLGWIVGEWEIRMPRVAQVRQRIVGAELEEREVVIGSVEEGGVATPVDPMERRVVVAARQRADSVVGESPSAPLSGGFASAGALLESYCGTAVAADSSKGILIGTIRTADGGPVKRARMRVSWGGDAAPRPRVSTDSDAETDESGGFFACGVPLGGVLRVGAPPRGGRGGPPPGGPPGAGPRGGRSVAGGGSG